MSLRLKFIILVTLLLCFIMLFVAFIINGKERNMIIKDMEDSGKVLSRTLTMATRDAILRQDFTLLPRYVNEVSKSKEVKTVIILDQDGLCLAHTNRSYENKPFSDRLSLSALKVTSLYINKDNDFFDIFVPIMVSDKKYGVVIVTFTYEIMNKLLAESRNYIFKFTIVVILMGFFFSIFLAHIITGPVMQLAKGAQEVSGGNLDHRIVIGSQDEIGTLALLFNQMTGNLQQNITALKQSNQKLDRKLFELSILYNVSQAMNLVKDLDNLLHLILSKAIEAISAKRGSLMLLNDETDVLEVKTIVGAKFKQAGKSVNLKRGEGIAGLVVEEGEPLLINMGSRDERFKKHEDYKDREGRVSSLLCVPLRVENEVFGVINLVNKIEKTALKNPSEEKSDNEIIDITETEEQAETESFYEFNNDDKDLLMALANQAAIAIKNTKLYELSITDGMTKLYLHRYFQIRLDEELVRARRYSTYTTLIMFDVDHFKNFNDTYGHQQGDIVLIENANIVKSLIRENDIAARYGGEEFAIIAPETDKVGGMILAERIRKTIEEYGFTGQNEALKVTISLGVSTIYGGSVKKMDFIKQTDDALYWAKEHGRNQSVFYDDIKAKLENETQQD